MEIKTSKYITYALEYESPKGVWDELAYSSPYESLDQFTKWVEDKYTVGPWHRIVQIETTLKTNVVKEYT